MENFLPVLSKRDFVRRFRAGEFGNRGPVWDTLGEFEDYVWEARTSGKKIGDVHLRNRVAGGETFYNLSPGTARIMWSNMKEPSQFYLAEMAPHHKNLIQGEVKLSERGLELFYTDVVGHPMRDALAIRQISVKGIIAYCVLRRFMCPNSYDWLQVLLKRYEDHVVEFSTFDCYWGTIPFQNTVWWEVRKY